MNKNKTPKKPKTSPTLEEDFLTQEEIEDIAKSLWIPENLTEISEYNSEFN
jgi:hypothetical protein